MLMDMDIERFHYALEQIINRYGKSNQEKKLCEEMDELTEAVADGDPEAVAEEVVDVYIMLLQMILLYDIPICLINRLMDYKIERTLFRMDQEDGKGEDYGEKKETALETTELTINA